MTQGYELIREMQITVMLHFQKPAEYDDDPTYPDSNPPLWGGCLQLLDIGIEKNFPQEKIFREDGIKTQGETTSRLRRVYQPVLAALDCVFYKQKVKKAEKFKIKSVW